MKHAFCGFDLTASYGRGFSRAKAFNKMRGFFISAGTICQAVSGSPGGTGVRISSGRRSRGKSQDLPDTVCAYLAKRSGTLSLATDGGRISMTLSGKTSAYRRRRAVECDARFLILRYLSPFLVSLRPVTFSPISPCPRAFYEAEAIPRRVVCPAIGPANSARSSTSGHLTRKNASPRCWPKR